MLYDLCDTPGVRDLEQYYCGLPFRHRLQFFLLLLDTYNLSLWYISRAVEVLSKLFVICTLMFHVFNLLKIFGDRVDRDPLTQIYNRKYFYEALPRVRSLRTEKGTSIMMLDIDNFKSINDNWGHLVGIA